MQVCRSGLIREADMVAPSVSGLFKWRQFEPEVILYGSGMVPPPLERSNRTAVPLRTSPLRLMRDWELRGAEIVELCLEDIDWRGGYLGAP